MADCILNIKSVYDHPEANDGYRILVDRLWPRGMSRSDIFFDEWMKDVAPSTSLPKWFNQEAKKWSAFSWRYQQELKYNNSVTDLISKLKLHKSVTMLYSASDKEHNHALALKQFITGNG